MTIPQDGALRRGNSKKLFQFTIMTVGLNGIGKSSFINTLFDRTLIPVRSLEKLEDVDLESHLPIQFTPYNLECDMYGNKLSVTVIDTNHFGESLNNTEGCTLFAISPHLFNSFRITQIKNYIEAQFQSFLDEENRIKRNPKFEDTRVHLLLYFIPPYYSNSRESGLKELDIAFMKALSPRVNIIPVIGKADSLSSSELEIFKAKIMSDIVANDIQLFNFTPEENEHSDAKFSSQLDINKLLPFAIISSENRLLNRSPRGRQLSYGSLVECDNPMHCDTSKLSNAIFNTHMEDLKDHTLCVLYETYRTEELSRRASLGTSSDPVPQTAQ